MLPVSDRPHILGDAREQRTGDDVAVPTRDKVPQEHGLVAAGCVRSRTGVAVGHGILPHDRSPKALLLPAGK